MNDLPEIYVKVLLGAEEPLQSKTINNKNNSGWKESFDFLYCDPQQFIYVHAWEDDLTEDDDSGGAIFPVSPLLDAPNNRREIRLLLGRTATGPLSLYPQISTNFQV